VFVSFCNDHLIGVSRWRFWGWIRARRRRCCYI